MSHKGRVALAVGLQLLVLVGMAGARQWTLSTGTVILLETVPVDPRDLFRGDYVVLNYRISTLKPSEFGASGSFHPGTRVYVGLERREKYWEPVSVGLARPRPPFLLGRVRYYFEASDRLFVEYGIESYFVPEGAGRQIQTTREALAVEVAVSRDGTAVIRRLFVGGQPLRY